MSGWQQPPTGGPKTYWQAEREEDPLRPGQMIRRGWRLYRSAPRAFLLVALVPAILQAALAFPGVGAAVRAVEGIVDVFGWYFEQALADPNNANSLQLQAEFQEQLELELQRALVPTQEAALVSAVLGAISLAVALIGGAALSRAALSAADGRTIDVMASFRAVLSRGGLVKPIAALTVASVVASALPILLQGSPEFQTWAGEPGSPRAVLLGSLFSVAALVLAIGVVVLAVRWAFYMPVVLVESLGTGAGLARAATLSRGLRGRLFVAMVGLVLLQWLAVALVATTLGFAIGIAAESVAAGFATYLAVSLLGSLLWAPVLPAMLALAYRERVRAGIGSGQGV